LEFLEVAGYQWFRPEWKAQSQGTVDEIDPFIAIACGIAEEDSTETVSLVSMG
jgi:hypothetical protein